MNRMRMTLVFLFVCASLSGVIHATESSEAIERWQNFQALENKTSADVINFPALQRDLQAKIVLDYICPQTAAFFYETCKAGRALVLRRFERHGRIGFLATKQRGKAITDYLATYDMERVLKEIKAFEHCQHFSLSHATADQGVLFRILLTARGESKVLKQLSMERLVSLSLHSDYEMRLSVSSDQKGLELFTSLRQLDVQGVGWAKLVSHLTALRKLENLGLYSVDITEEDQGIIGGLTNLRSLSLSVSGVHVDRLMGLTGLRRLKLVHCGLGSANHKERVLQSLHRVRLASFYAFTQLEVLDIRANELRDEVSYAGFLANLRFLDISNNVHLAKGEERIKSLDFLRKLPLLEELICRSNCLATWNHEPLTVLETLSLRKLDLSGNAGITMGAVRYITGLTTLHTLNLACSSSSFRQIDLQDIVIEGVTELLKMTQLQELDVTGNGIGRYADCVKALKTMPCMRELKL